MSNNEKNETIADKAKEGIASATAAAKEQLDALKTKEGRDALKEKAKEGLTAARKQIGMLKTKEGRKATRDKIKGLSLKGKVVLGGVAFGLIVILCCIGSCLFADRHLDKMLGPGMTRYVNDWQKLQGKVVAAVAKLSADDKVQEKDVFKRNREAFTAARELAEYTKVTKVPGNLTEKGNKVAQLLKEIASMQHNLWHRHNHVLPLKADAFSGSCDEEFNMEEDKKRERNVTDAAMANNFLHASEEAKKHYKEEIEYYRKNYGEAAGDAEMADRFGVNVDLYYHQAGMKINRNAKLPLEEIEKRVKECESDLYYMASDERREGENRRQSSSYQVAITQLEEDVRGKADKLNKLAEYDNFKRKAHAEASRLTKLIDAKLRTVEGLLKNQSEEAPQKKEESPKGK